MVKGSLRRGRGLSGLTCYRRPSFSCGNQHRKVLGRDSKAGGGGGLFRGRVECRAMTHGRDMRAGLEVIGKEQLVQ